VVSNIGVEAAAEFALFEMAHLQAIKDLAKKEKIDCELSFKRAHHVVTDKMVLGGVKSLIHALQNSREEYSSNWQFIEGPEAAMASSPSSSPPSEASEY
jgi:hypothetical protein